MSSIRASGTQSRSGADDLVASQNPRDFTRAACYRCTAGARPGPGSDGRRGRRARHQRGHHRTPIDGHPRDASCRPTARSGWAPDVWSGAGSHRSARRMPCRSRPWRRPDRCPLRARAAFSATRLGDALRPASAPASACGELCDCRWAASADEWAGARPAGVGTLAPAAAALSATCPARPAARW
jgi:hypothetical protein